MPGKWFFFATLLALLGHSLALGQNGNPPTPQGEMSEETQQQMPSLELLEFLGEWETDEGQWVDPAEIDQIQLPDQEQEDGE